ncbi:hypothetical protein CGG80_05730 [Vibrio parahaemolyticus]|uniref:gamma-mobile-trio recombinase GmtY n=1 Tax=Vibrio parahaemolyticus TaxID=670 RepID=UPI0011246601|nr:gamma-mobile-trio recombinase GmtY [Vibrio parahaemolyticus]TOQ03398.1 hypothetical protein CGH03_21620 [Vibrio parahaemolyticus]TOR18769.1 hypothetical protein CGG80_05730 [Vibrio parahaemolyticus]HCG7748524.1 site-specific integrase [Vibrio parahaemolyticus]
MESSTNVTAIWIWVKRKGFEPKRLKLIQVGDGVLTSYAHYSWTRKTKGETWKNESALAVSLLLEYYFATLSTHCGAFKNMFEAFADAVRYGTVDLNGKDHTGLWWKPHSAHRSNVIIRHVTNYSDWLYHKSGDENALLNPRVKASRHVYMLNMAAYYHKKHNSFLTHTYNDEKAKEKAKWTRSVGKFPEPRRRDPLARFNGDNTWAFIDSFTFAGKTRNDPIYHRLKLPHVLMFLLMRYGGLRAGECLHIYFNDITLDPSDSDSALVFVHHPSLGLAPKEWRDSTGRSGARRREYLSDKFGLLPRSDPDVESAAYKAGWKNPVLTTLDDRKPELGGNYMVVNWSNPDAGRLFWKYWILYLQYQRPRNVKHPFALCNADNNKPLSYPAMLNSMNSVSRRLGLSTGKQSGNTPHGLRHLYKFELEEMGISERIIQHMMHHSSITSQSAYAPPSDAEVRSAIDMANTKLASKKANTVTNRLEQDF